MHAGTFAIDTSTFVLALVILAHGWAPKIPASPGNAVAAAAINLIAIVVVLLLLFFGAHR